MAVFPAYAGVNLVDILRTLVLLRIPRACGGVPQSEAVSAGVQKYSPRMRGCSETVFSAKRTAFVFPAHAGVFLSSINSPKQPKIIVSLFLPIKRRSLQVAHKKQHLLTQKSSGKEVLFFSMKHYILQDNHSSRKNLLRLLTVIFTKDKTGSLSSSCQLPQHLIIYLVIRKRKKPIIILSRT